MLDYMRDQSLLLTILYAVYIDPFSCVSILFTVICEKQVNSLTSCGINEIIYTQIVSYFRRIKRINCVGDP